MQAEAYGRAWREEREGVKRKSIKIIESDYFKGENIVIDFPGITDLYIVVCTLGSFVSQ